MRSSGTTGCSAQAVTITVDARDGGTPLNPIWTNFGYDEVNYTTTPLGQQLLQTLAAINSNPVHIRTHFLLNSGDGGASLKWGSTNVYSLDAGTPVYDWTLLDGIMDTITDAGDLPLAEISFMPRDLSPHPDPYQNSSVYSLNGGCFYPPTDFGEWAGLISTWASHSDARYPNVGQSWFWELWNEPNTGYFNGTVADYEHFFDVTEQALHAQLPTATLGGPETIGIDPFFQEFLEHCDTGTNTVSGASGTRLDAITFHAKGGVALVNGNVEMNMGNQLSIHDANFSTVANFPDYVNTPITIGEADPDACAACPTSQYPQNAYRNSTAYGAYELEMMKRSQELADRAGVNLRGLVTWAFLVNGEPLFGGYRTLATQGIHKPVLNDFKLLGQLHPTRLPLQSSGALAVDEILSGSVRGAPDIDGLAATDGTEVQVLVWNYHDDLVAVPDAPVALTLLLPPKMGAEVTVTHQRVDESHSDAYTAWLAMGSPPAPTASQWSALQSAMQLAPLNPPQALAVTNGEITLCFSLPRFGASLITVAPVSGASAPRMRRGHHQASKP